MSNWMKLMWCTAGGLGLLPKAPGTWGSLKPLVVTLVCGHFGLIQIWLMVLLGAIIVASSIATVVLSPWYSKHFGKEDPPQVVSDEVAGQSIALLGMAWVAPSSIGTIAWIGLAILAFVFFRIFDIWKPGCINTSQQLKAGYGVLMDDIFAGIVAGGIILLIAMNYPVAT
jgi:phosphatidylglycerophosphatase A